MSLAGCLRASLILEATKGGSEDGNIESIWRKRKQRLIDIKKTRGRYICSVVEYLPSMCKVLLRLDPQELKVGTQRQEKRSHGGMFVP